MTSYFPVSIVCVVISVASSFADVGMGDTRRLYGHNNPLGWLCMFSMPNFFKGKHLCCHTYHSSSSVIITKGIRGTTRQLYDSALWCTYIMAASVCSGTS